MQVVLIAGEDCRKRRQNIERGSSEKHSTLISFYLR